ncbi:hypothetical protein [Flavobacterium sp. HJSW_4]|uniref:hypothetical protein n=1 Tax=Flavobacterium sp. HJSW_4 TaxID=3344660 RepID=UPI0035F39873
MRSKLSLIEFRNQIKENTVIGNPKLKLISPFSLFRIFRDFSKPFYGNFDDSTFRLTTNSTVSPSFFIIKGNYKTVNRTLHINYNIEPTHKFQTIWLKYYPLVAFILFNSVFISQEEVPLQVYVIFNLFVVLSILLTRWIPKRKRRNLEKKFTEIFEIIVQ